MASADKIREIFDGALDRSGEARQVFLDGACAGDAALRAKVDALIGAAENPDAFLSEPTAGAAAATIAAPIREIPGTRIGPYKLLQLIGEGGFGSVFMAEQEKPVQRKVALKIIKLGMDTRQVVARFEQERQALAMMDHPNIAKVLDAGATETGRPFFVMELVRGDPITEYCDRNNLSTADRLGLFAQVCHAVQHAHTKGIIHRDIKPSNVLITVADGRPIPKVIDFGIAKATASKLTEKTLFTEHRALIGTPEYMSPEQAEMSGVDIDTRSDIYSLGVLLYELLTGTTPFSSKELRSAAYAEIQRIIREVEPPKPSTRVSTLGETLASTAAHRRTEPTRLSRAIRGDLDWIVMKALEKDRTRRYETANGLAADVQRHLSGEAVVAAPPSNAYRLRKLVRRNKGPVLAGGAVAVALLIGAVAFAWQARVAGHQRDLAVQAREAEAEQRKQAEKSAAIAEAVARFQTDMLSAVDPSQLPKDPVTGEPMKDAVTVVQAIEAAVKKLDEDGGALKDQPLVEASVRIAIGTTLRALARYAESEPNLRKSLALHRATLPAGHPNIAVSLNELALVLKEQNKPAEAETLYREAIQICRNTLPDGATDLANCLYNLSRVLKTQNRLAEAELLCREALQFTRETLPAGDRGIAPGLNHLGLLLQDQNKLAEAESLFREALVINRAALPAEHPDTATTLNNLAALLMRENKLAEAEPLMREALKMLRAALPIGHPEIATGLNNLTWLLMQQNNLAEAEPFMREAVEILRTVYPAGHPDIAHGLNNLASLYWRQGKLDQSIPMFEESLALHEMALGKEHPSTRRVMANLGVNYRDAGRLSEAIPLLEEAYRASKQVPTLAWVGPALLDAYVKSADPAKPETVARATKLVGELVADARAKLAEDSPELAGQLAAFSLPLLVLKSWDEAEPLMRECLAIREKAEPDDWRTFNTKSMLGGALLGQNKLAEAEPLLLEGHNGMKEREAAIPPQAKDLRFPEALERLVHLYEARDKAEPGKGYDAKAAEWRVKLGAARAEQGKPDAEERHD